MGTEDNQGQLVFYPVQYRSDTGETGTLRAFEQLHLRIYYQDFADSGDWRAPVIRQVETVRSSDQIEISLNVFDPDQAIGEPVGVADVMITFSTDGVTWDTVLATTQGAGHSWSASVDLPPYSHTGELSFFVQAVDHAGNVAFSSNKGRLYSHAFSESFLPLVLRKHQ
jgi:hypothetical protein